MSTMHKQDAAAPSVQQILDAITGREASSDELRELIAAALADAERNGAGQMREVAAANVDRLAKRLSGSSKQMSRECAVVIRAAQLPGRVVALSDGEKTE